MKMEVRRVQMARGDYTTDKCTTWQLRQSDRRTGEENSQRERRLWSRDGWRLEWKVWYQGKRGFPWRAEERGGTTTGKGPARKLVVSLYPV